MMLKNGIRQIFVLMIGFYQAYLSPLKRPSCRFYPTCSTYSLTLFKLTHPLIALFFSIIRILKCNPWVSGGYDYPLARIRIASLEYHPIVCVYWFVPTQARKFPILFSKPLKIWVYILIL